jgi:hypothetical protein
LQVLITAPVEPNKGKIMGQQIFIKTLTRRKTRANDPLPSQPGAGGQYSGGALVAPTGTSQTISTNFGGNTLTSYAGQSVAGATNQIALVDLNDGPTRRIFSNKSTTVVVLPDVVTNFQIPGAVTTGSANTGLVYRVPRNMTIWGVVAQIGTKPSGGAGSLTVDLVSAASPTAAGTSIFVDSARVPSIGSATDYSVLGDNLTTFTGLPGGSAIVNAGNVGNTLVGTSNVGQGINGNSNVFAGSVVTYGVLTPNNTFQANAGSFLRVQIGQTGTLTNLGTALSVQIFGY